MEQTEKPNVFAQMQNQEKPNTSTPKTQPSGEISIDDFSNTSIGEKIKYNRPDLHAREDVIEKFQVFMPDASTEPLKSLSGNSKYWPVTMILTYASLNADGLNNREYISGCRAFQNQDGGMSDLSFWYDGAGNQSAYLWELVAQHKNIDPKDMSPRQFVAFLNSKPTVLIQGIEYDNFGAKPGEPRKVKKNMPGKFE